jgi:hypothetical protein
MRTSTFEDFAIEAWVVVGKVVIDGMVWRALTTMALRLAFLRQPGSQSFA